MSERVEYITNTVELAHMRACVTAIRAHLGGKPELVGELVRELRCMVKVAETVGWQNATTGRNITLSAARALLSRIKEQTSG